MFALNLITAVVTTLFFLTITSTNGDKSLGSLYQCAHDLRGKVWVKNDREILIQGFNYDGKGPSAWFHGQLRPAKGISNSDSSKYIALPYPGSSCDRLKPGRTYKDENVTLILPRSVKDFETIGIFCYEYCHNFGHIIIPEDLSVPEAPESLEEVFGCRIPNYDQCSSTKNGALKPNCKAGAPQQIPVDQLLLICMFSVFGIRQVLTAYY